MVPNNSLRCGKVAEERTIFGIIFLLSFIVRAGVCAIMNKKIKEVREVDNFDLKTHIKEMTKKLGIGKSEGKFFESIGADNS